MPVTIKNTDDNLIVINGYRFYQDDFEKIQTQIQNNDFNGEQSHIKTNLYIRRVDDELALSKPKTDSEGSGTPLDLIDKPDEWKDYAQAPHEEWQAEFEQLDL